MRALLTLVLLAVASPCWAQIQGQAPAKSGFDRALTASVLGAALTFIAPRALEPVTVQQLAVWGLSAPAALDGTLTTDVRDGTVVLLRNNATIYAQPLPPDNDAAGWGDLAAGVLNAAVAISPGMRDAGGTGVITAFFDELFNHLDPYSRYIPPEAAGVDRSRRSGEAGAGIRIRAAGRGFTVIDVNASGPGADADIRVGDQLIAVDDQAVAGESLTTVQSWLAGLEGTVVTLTIRTGRARARTAEVERAVTPPETVFASRSPPLAVLRITSFSRDTDERLAAELTRLLAGAAGRAIKGVLLDLRGNRGGLLRQSVAATDMLLERGIIATTAGRNPRAQHEWRAEPPDITAGLPLVILVDGRSASAAEIMAAALQDQGRGVVVGSSTLGKGLVQTIASLPDGGELFVSWSRVLAPSGWPLQGLGVLPQVCTSNGQDATAEQLAQLGRNIQPLAEALARHRAARPPLPAAEALALRTACPAAEARDSDIETARFLVTHPVAYNAALLTPP